jgi:uncharacterized repeat protein (TIGR01451 family)
MVRAVVSRSWRWLALGGLLALPSGLHADEVNVGVGTLPPGKAITIRFGARVANPVAGAATQVSNQGTLSGANFPSLVTDDPDTATAGDATVTVLNVADLSLSKSGLPNPVFAAGSLTYTLTVINAGPGVAQGATLTDVLPAGTTFQSLTAAAGWGCAAPAVGTAGTVVCSNPAFAPGSAIFTLVTGVSSGVLGGPVITNTASVAAATSDQNPGDEVASSAVTVAASADLSITKVGPGPVFPGSNVAYTLVVTNHGPDMATGISVGDATPAGLTFVGNGGDCTTPFPCTFASLAAGQSRTINATFNVPVLYAGADPITNDASVSSTMPDPNGANDVATALTPVNLAASGLNFHTLDPCRLLDTREAPAPRGGPALQALGVRVFPLVGVCGIPATAKALSVNVTVTQGSTLGHVLIYSSGPPPPLVSSTTNYALGQTRGNNAIVSLNRDGEVSVFVVQPSGSVHFILDVNGYFQ